MLTPVGKMTNWLVASFSLKMAEQSEANSAKLRAFKLIKILIRRLLSLNLLILVEWLAASRIYFGGVVW